VQVELQLDVAETVKAREKLLVIPDSLARKFVLTIWMKSSKNLGKVVLV